MPRCTRQNASPSNLPRNRIQPERKTKDTQNINNKLSNISPKRKLNKTKSPSNKIEDVDTPKPQSPKTENIKDLINKNKLVKETKSPPEKSLKRNSKSTPEVHHKRSNSYKQPVENAKKQAPSKKKEKNEITEPEIQSVHLKSINSSSKETSKKVSKKKKAENKKDIANNNEFKDNALLEKDKLKPQNLDTLEKKAVSKKRKLNSNNPRKDPPVKKKKDDIEVKNIAEKTKKNSTKVENEKSQKSESVPLLDGSKSLIEKEINTSKPVLNKSKKKSNAKLLKTPSPKKVDKSKTAMPKSLRKKAPTETEGNRKSNDENSDDDNKASNLLRVANEYIVEGFKDDCEYFIQKCQRVSKLNFEKFSIIWKDMGFSNIYKGRQSGAEIAEVSEEVIHVAKSYMLARDRTFEVNVAGLFLVYGLLNLQPYEDFAALRLVPKDVPALLALETEARKQRRHDIIYVLGRILTEGPCQFHVANRECGLEHCVRKYYDGSVIASDANTQPIGVLSHNAEALSLIKTLTTLDHKYNEAKRLLQNRSGPDPSLNFISLTAEELEDSIQNLIPSFLRERKGRRKSLEQSYEEEREDKLKSIKDRAMTNVVNPMRHLTGLDERQNKQSPPTPSTSKSVRKKILRGTFSAKTLNQNFEIHTDESGDEVRKSKNILEMTHDELRENVASKRAYNKPWEKNKNRHKKGYNLLTYSTDDETDDDETRGLNDTCKDNNMPSLNIEDHDATAPEKTLRSIELLDSNIGRPLEVEIIIPDVNHSFTENQANLDVKNNAGRPIEVEIIDLYKGPHQNKKGHESDDNEPENDKTNVKEVLNVKDSSNDTIPFLAQLNRKIRTDRRCFKRSQLKSKLKKLGISDIADLEDNEEQVLG